MKWVTREKARVDRIACPWLIRRFIDPDAVFRYVPADQVPHIAAAEGAIPFDAPGVELNHYVEDGKEYVSFDAIIRKYRLDDPALLRLARIVRVADGGSGESPEAAGLKAAADGFRGIAEDDLDNQRLQFPLYDALYEHCRQQLLRSTTAPRPS
jgi:hypothetical protein